MPYTLTPVVRRRLKKVRDLILARPKQFAMEEYVARSRQAAKQGKGLEASNYPNSVKAAENCGTTCCIAGWFHLMTPKQERARYARMTLANALTPTLDMWGVDSVVGANLWPEPFRTKFDNAKGPKAEARVAAARIDHLLATGE